MLRLIVLTTLCLMSACVTSVTFKSTSKVAMDCHTYEHPNFHDFFAVECRLRNLTDTKQSVQVSFVRFPNFTEDMVMLVPNHEYQQILTYQNTFRAGAAMRFSPIASELSAQESARALTALISQVVKRGKSVDSQSQMGYEKNFLLRKDLELKPHQTLEALVLLKKKQNAAKLPRDIEISVTKPSESILTRSL